LIHSKATGTAAATPTTSAAAVTTAPVATTTTATTTPATAVPTPAAPAATVVKVVAGTPKINFLGKGRRKTTSLFPFECLLNFYSVSLCHVCAGGNYLNTLGGPKANRSEEAPAAAPVTVAAAATTTAPVAVQAIKKEAEVPMTAAAATETAQEVVAQWEEEKVIQPVGQDYVEELRGGDGILFEHS
jgi:hypothetical protein